MTATSGAGDYERLVLDELSAGVHAWLTAIAAAGHDPEAFAGPGDLAGRMLATLPAPHPWDDQIGPFHDTPGLAKLLGISKQAIADRVRRRTVLAATTKSGRLVYPTFQLEGRRLRAEITDILSVFRGAPVDGWALAAWFTTPSESLGGATPVQWLDADGDAGPVLALARDAAQRWAA